MYLESKSECKIFNKDGDQNVYLFHFFLSLPCWAIFFFFFSNILVVSVLTIILSGYYKNVALLLC